MSVKKGRSIVHVISHGPYCLDGMAAAVALALYHRDKEVVPQFVTYRSIDETLLALRCEPDPSAHEIWITDISWTAPEVDGHLHQLLKRGTKIYWIDHHRTALERYAEGEVKVPLTDVVVSEAYAASRLLYDYLAARLHATGDTNDRFSAAERLILMADDNDRWLHRIPGSRELAVTVGALGADAYQELLSLDADITYTERMRRAASQVNSEMEKSFELARRSRVVHRGAAGVTVMAAVCDGYASEIGEAWGRESPNTVIALFDARTLGISLRRSPDCRVDLSHVARQLGGGGHAAAAGAEMPALRSTIAECVAAVIQPVLADLT